MYENRGSGLEVGRREESPIKTGSREQHIPRVLTKKCHDTSIFITCASA